MPDVNDYQVVAREFLDYAFTNTADVVRDLLSRNKNLCEYDNCFQRDSVHTYLMGFFDSFWESFPTEERHEIYSHDAQEKVKKFLEAYYTDRGIVSVRSGEYWNTVSLIPAGNQIDIDECIANFIAMYRRRAKLRLLVD